MPPPVSRRAVLAGAGVAAATAAVGGPAAAAGRHARPRPTIVLVHGAFADASGWSRVIEHLTRAGHTVVAPPNPLRGVRADSAYLAAFLATLPGPLVLAGHSYGGVLITNAARGNENVRALVYVAAFAPDAGETVPALQSMFPGTGLTEAALDFRAHPHGVEGYVKRSAFREVFAGDLPRSEADLLWATQRPGDTATLSEASGEPAWKTVPSHFLVARGDNLIPAAAQRFMADRAGAHTVETDASHAVMLSEPRITAALIAKASR
ncbi:alpha/beta fold hydrolase [Streptomyces genisteinicus]|uniref:Alpha/beta hydrolase n=1 Tax=Streptomyces genisteinicus TaxID=2768068 RepID=A0A7H0I4R1_9ACTN|nr:alpha/beta hydrolase [Streptomyces genisteinicus]QNP67777.1 alpha/beta hydrolase [Streptomyces genisteinicus]